ncbi:MAG: SH3 domain-containing protein [Anaerolineales bacterium]|nr:MAG: SH3 domain-containing protein [Anaerolineales bacterium]
MKQMRARIYTLTSTIGIAVMSLTIASGVSAAPARQEPTVTGTPEGPTILVPEQVNVRLGPSTDYEKVGVLIAGQTASALGRSPGGEWIQIYYAGVPGNTAWVYAPFVVLETGQRLLPIIEPPPTPTPRVTATIDPTLAAQFNIGAAPPTRLPTFTPAAPVSVPTFEPAGGSSSGGFPPIMAILALLVVGVFGTIISVLRGG